MTEPVTICGHCRGAADVFTFPSAIDGAPVAICVGCWELLTTRG